MASYFFQLFKLTTLVSSLTLYQLNSVQSLIRVRLFVIPWTAACQASLSFNISWNLLKLLSIESVMPCNYLILCRPLSSCSQSFPGLGSFLISQLFASGGQSIGASASASAPSNKYSGLISFRMNWFDVLALQGALKNLLHCPSMKIIHCTKTCHTSYLL